MVSHFWKENPLVFDDEILEKVIQLNYLAILSPQAAADVTQMPLH